MINSTKKCCMDDLNKISQVIGKKIFKKIIIEPYTEKESFKKIKVG